MVGVFLRLKLRLLRRRIARADVLGLLGFVLVWVGSVGGGVLAGALFAALVRLGPLDADGIGLVTVGAFTLVWVAWAVGPVTAASIDDSLDPRRFELLPLSPRRLATGLLVAGMSGPGGAGTFLGLAVGTIGGLGSPAAALPLLVVALVATMLGAFSARLLTTVLSDLLRSRRFQEVAALVFGLLVTIPALVVGPALEEGSVSGEGLAATVEVAGWFPPGALGGAAVAFGTGRWGLGLGLLAYGLAAVAVVVWLTGLALHRLQTRSAPSRKVRAGRAGSRGPALLPRLVPLPASPVGAVAAKELRYLVRDPRIRSQLVGSVVALVVIGFTAGSTLVGSPFAPFLAAAAAFFLIASVLPNQFGVDAGTFWGYLVTLPSLGDVMRGKNLAWGLVAGPVVVLVAVAGAVLAGDATYLAPGMLGGLGILLVWMTVGNVTSILGGYPLPETNLFGNRNVSGAAMISFLLGLALSGVLTIPLAALVVVPAVLWGPAWAGVGALLGLGYTVAAYVAGLRYARSLLEARTFQLLETLDA